MLLAGVFFVIDFFVVWTWLGRVGTTAEFWHTIGAELFLYVSRTLINLPGPSYQLLDCRSSQTCFSKKTTELSTTLKVWAESPKSSIPDVWTSPIGVISCVEFVFEVETAQTLLPEAKIEKSNIVEHFPEHLWEVWGTSLGVWGKVWGEVWGKLFGTCLGTFGEDCKDNLGMCLDSFKTFVEGQKNDKQIALIPVSLYLICFLTLSNYFLLWGPL